MGLTECLIAGLIDCLIEAVSVLDWIESYPLTAFVGEASFCCDGMFLVVCDRFVSVS